MFAAQVKAAISVCSYNTTLYCRVGVSTDDINLVTSVELANSNQERSAALSYCCSAFLYHCSLRSTTAYSIDPPTLRQVHHISQTSPAHHSTMADSLHTQPPPTPTYLLSYPAPHIILVTINRPKAMNSLPYATHWEADALFNWFDAEPSLRVAIITGAGDKAFCAGQDLIEQSRIKTHPQPRQMMTHPFSGFAGISRRTGKKPILAAVNGFALGGGFEICLNW
jgi:hypothetical protein